MGVDLPRITLITTGGTIEQLGLHRLDTTRYVEEGRRLEPGALLRRLPEIDRLARVDEVQFSRLDSSNTSPELWCRLGQLVQDNLDRDDVDGVVITHGTNTLEETAYFLHLTVKSAKPVVVVGAMRPASALGSDALPNLYKAVLVAASATARSRGVLVLVGDALFSARDVTKTSTRQLDAFQAPDLGPLGFADTDGRVVFHHRQERAHTLATPFTPRDAVDLPRVDIVLSYPGADAALIHAAVTAGAAGIVVAGTGSGRPTAEQEEALDDVVQCGVLVCHASRAGAGPVIASTGRTARRIVAAEDLQPWKARVLLMLAMTITKDVTEIQEMFEHN
jgi:L-asparaginase